MAKVKKDKLKPNWLDPNTTAENEVLPRYVKWAWSSRAMSLSLNVVLIMQLTYYCTDMLGLSATLVGTLLLASKLFDGVTDLLVGYVIDRTHTRFGKARPYEVCIVFVWLFTILLFSTPEMGVTGKCVYVFIMYALINSVCSTFLNGCDSVYLARSIRSEKNRVSVMAFNGAIVMLGSIVFSIVLPQLVAGIGATKVGWTVISASLGIPLGIIGVLRFFFVKEVVVDAPATADTKELRAKSSVPLKTSLKCILQNKYAWLLAGMTLAVQITTNTCSAVNTYYFKYIIGNIGMASYVSMAAIVTPFVMLVFPALTRKFGTVGVLKFGAIMGVVGYGLRIIGGTNIVTILIGSLIGGVAVLPLSMMINIYLIDTMDYGEWKTGVRVEGMLSSVNAFAHKLGSGIASGLVGLIMGLAGYDGSLAVQSAAANTSIIVLFNWVPTILMAALLILAMNYNLDKIMPDVHKDLAAGK